MAISVERAVRAIKHALGGPLSRGMTDLDCIQLMYGKLFALREGWTWATSTIRLGTVAGSDRIDLPTSFTAVLTTLAQDPRLCILRNDQFELWRSQYLEGGFLPSAGGAGGRNYATIRNDEDGRPYLQFIAPFTQTEADRFFLSIALGPEDITDARQILPLPFYMHNVFLSLCRAKARELEEPEESPEGTLVDAVLNSSDWHEAIRADIRQKPAVHPQDFRLRSVAHVWPFSNEVAPVIVNGVFNWPN